MMANLHWQGDGWSIDIDSVLEIPLTAPALTGFAAAVGKMAETVSFTKLDLKPPPPDFEWSWQASDGRSWKQVLRFVDGVRYDGDFQVPDFFTMDELLRNRDVRDQVVRLIGQYQATRVKVRR